ncbi:MAG: hypothetical protein ACOCRX_04730 [Candidatus Woesearchaeota archaeon]
MSIADKITNTLYEKQNFLAFKNEKFKIIKDESTDILTHSTNMNLKLTNTKKYTDTYYSQRINSKN